MSITLREYVDDRGRSPFGRWFDDLDAAAAAQVATALVRMEQGNFSNVKGVGGGVFEYKIDFGPGYRVYFGKDSDTLVILIAGGTKKRQAQDVMRAEERWADYKRRKARGE
jgi:putative addiction module killer protein